MVKLIKYINGGSAMELLCSKKYLVFPVREGAPERRVRFFVEGQQVYDVVSPLDFA